MNCALLTFFISMVLFGTDEELTLKAVPSPPTISLQQALDYAKEANLDLKKRYNQVLIAQSAVSFAPLLPQLSLSASHERDLTNTLGNDANKAGFTLKTSLLDMKSMVAIKSFKDALDAAQLTYDHETDRLFLNVSKAYIEALIAQSIREIAKEEREQFFKQLEVHRKKALVGLARPLDVSRAEYLLNKSESDLALKERDFARKLAQLGVLLNRSESFLVRDFVVESAYFNEKQEKLLELAQNNADTKALKKEYSSHNYAIISEGLDFIPKLSTQIEGGWRAHYEANALLGPSEPFAKIMFTLELPLFSGGSSRAALKKKIALRSSTELSQRELSLNKELGIAGIFEQITAYQIALKSAELALDAATKSKNSADRLYNAGEATALELVEANVNLVSAKSLALNARLRLSQSKIQLLFLIGKMSELRHIT